MRFERIRGTTARRGAAGVLLACALLATPAAASPGGGHSRAGRGSASAGTRAHMARIPAGSYRPLYGTARVEVAAFQLDRYPVTRAEYAAFLRLHPEWRGSVGADALEPGADGARPVTDVPRAAAEAYCAAEGKRLPSTDEWEYAAAASATRRDGTSDDAFKQRLLELYTRPRPARPEPVGSTFRNVYGIWDLHGLVWEWTAAAHMAMAHHAMAHAGGSVAHDMGCAGSAAGASDTRDYAAFLRYAFRAALTPTTKLGNLGFRCAR